MKPRSNDQSSRFKKRVLQFLIAVALRRTLASPVHLRGHRGHELEPDRGEHALAFPPPAGGAPPALQVNMAMVQGAVYDAVNAIEPRHRPYLLATRFAATASKEAAAATAAYRVLSNIVSTVPATFRSRTRRACCRRLHTAYEASLAAIPEDHQGRGDRRGERRGRRDDRRPARRRTLRAVTVEAER